MTQQYFDILGLNYNASKEEIKKKYRQLSLKLHPDKHCNDPEKGEQFKKINEAYDILYNTTNQLNSVNELNDLNIYNNLFDIFNKHRNPEFNQEFAKDSNQDFYKRYKNNKPKSIHKILSISLTDAYAGVHIPIKIIRKIIENQITYDESETIYINIPKGTDHDEILIIKNKGNIVNAIQSHIKIKIQLIEHNIFKRDGLNLIFTKNITFKESICGFSFNLKHLNNKYYTINNESGIIVHSETNNVIPKLGFMREDTCGDLIIKYEIIYPDKLDESIIQKLNDIL